MDDLHRIMYLFFCGYIHYDPMSSVCNLFLSVVFEMLSFPFPVIQKGNFVLSSLGSALLAESSHQTNSLTHQSSNHCACMDAHTHNHISAQPYSPSPWRWQNKPPGRQRHWQRPLQLPVERDGFRWTGQLTDGCKAETVGTGQSSADLALCVHRSGPSVSRPAGVNALGAHNVCLVFHLQWDSNCSFGVLFFLTCFLICLNHSKLAYWFLCYFNCKE